ncbi:GAF domain-containing protein [Prauserella oleivorans]|uniref:GAF domain-containing protein n=1 Tax=Prauserella oleivorans TaxID=1478153 RepID=A0ABW5WC25_9PSEU
MVTYRSDRRLLEAVVSVAQDLRLQDVLQRIVRAARDLVDAEYGALGVIGEDGQLSEFITVGMDAGTRERIGPLPTGGGVLGQLITHPHPLRLADLREHPAATGFPPQHPPMRSFLGVPIRVRDAVFGNLYLTDKRGGEFTQYDQDLVCALAASAGLAIHNASLYERTRLRQRWLEASHEVTSTLLSGGNPADALPLIAERARTVSGASVAAIARPVPGDASRLRFDAIDTGDLVAGDLSGLWVAAEGTATGEAFSTGKPVSVRGYGRLAAEYQQGFGTRLPPFVAHLDSALAVPLTVGDTTLGVLVVAKVDDTVPFSDDEMEFVQGFATHAALALEFVRAAEDRERIAVFEDRERIAHDLHDLVIQRLFAIGLGLEALGKSTGEPRVAAQVGTFVANLDQTIRDIRDSIFSLQEPSEAPGSLRGHLLGLALEAAPALGFHPRVGFDGPLDTAVPDVVRPDVTAALREALSNITRHARARSVSADVAVDRTGTTLTLTVADDGAGMPPRPRHRGGLDALARRAARWDGRLSLRETPGGGTTLTWAIHLPRDEEDSP